MSINRALLVLLSNWNLFANGHKRKEEVLKEIRSQLIIKVFKTYQEQLQVLFDARVETEKIKLQLRVSGW